MAKTTENSTKDEGKVLGKEQASKETIDSLMKRLEALEKANSKLNKEIEKARSLTPTSVTNVKELDKFENEIVTIKVDPMRNKEDDTHLTVIVNGRITQIQKGQKHRVPRYVARIIDETQKQQVKALNYVSSQVNNNL